MTGPLETQIGLVAIGRNEGERLRACLSAATREGAPVVYVDSGSTDDSLAIATGFGVAIVELDLSVPFTAARARNAGLERLIAAHPDLSFVQFIDGDCTLAPDWLAAARERLETEPGLAVVAGRRRERFPERSIFNRLCDMEWNTPVGAAKAVGGDALYRIDAFRAVGGFDGAFICGEEPELCLRLRRAGWSVERLDRDMTLHDAAMTEWGQWWTRNIRSGWAYAEGAAVYGADEERYNVKQARSVLLWGLIIPSVILAFFLFGLIYSPVFGALALPGVLAYPLMALKIALARQRDRGDPLSHALLYGFMTMLGKFPQLIGMRRYRMARRAGRQAEIIEYKSGAHRAGDAAR